ncbi:MAG: peptidase U62, partial [Acidobacteria bacterium]|nr:peptidase U62 [Acidobacteriota bacterium]
MRFTLRVASGLLGIGLSVLLVPRVNAGHKEDAATAKSLAAAHAAANGDPLLEALLTELERSKDQLKMDQVAPPYYIEYRVSDVQEFIAEAAFGALRENQKVHVRLLRVVVRVGDYKQDSYYGEGMGQTTILPLDNDPIALRRQIWLATDQAYKDAGQALTQKQAALKQFTADEHPVDDFAKAPVVTLVEPLASLKVDETGWKKTLEET